MLRNKITGSLAFIREENVKSYYTQKCYTVVEENGNKFVIDVETINNIYEEVGKEEVLKWNN